MSFLIRLLVKKYEQRSSIKGYYAYMMKRNPTIGGFLKAKLETKNEYEKFTVAVEKCGAMVEYLSKEKLVATPKVFLCFYVEG